MSGVWKSLILEVSSKMNEQSFPEAIYQRLDCPKSDKRFGHFDDPDNCRYCEDGDVKCRDCEKPAILQCPDCEGYFCRDCMEHLEITTL